MKTLDARSSNTGATRSIMDQPGVG
jgi:hypothetical protein